MAVFRHASRGVTTRNFWLCEKAFRYFIKEIDSTLPCVCSEIDHRRRQNVVKTSVTHSAIAFCATFLFLPDFDVICDQLLKRRTAAWNLFLNCTSVEMNFNESLTFHNNREKNNVKSFKSGIESKNLSHLIDNFRNCVMLNN